MCDLPAPCIILFTNIKLSWLTAIGNDGGLTSYFPENTTTVPLCDSLNNTQPSCVDNFTDWVSISSYSFQIGIFSDSSVSMDGFQLAWKCSTQNDHNISDECIQKDPGDHETG